MDSGFETHNLVKSLSNYPDELLAGQGIYAEVKKGAAAVAGAAGTSAMGDEVKAYNSKVDSELKSYPNGITVQSPLGAGVGAHARLATQSELKNFHDNSVRTIQSLKGSLQNHIEAANNHASKAGGGLGSKVHSLLAEHHTQQAQKTVEKIKNEQSNLKEIGKNLQERFKVPASREAQMASAGVSVPKGTGTVGAQPGHPFYGNQHVAGN
jgi:hypothetical protein